MSWMRCVWGRKVLWIVHGSNFLKGNLQSFPPEEGQYRIQFWKLIALLRFKLPLFLIPQIEFIEGLITAIKGMGVVW